MADRYCTECGRPLTPEDKFCPGCGATVQEWDDYAPQTAQNEKKEQVRQSSGSLMPIIILTLIWAVFALAVGAYLIMDASALTQAVKDALVAQPYESGTMWDYVVSQGVTEQMLTDSFALIGMTFAVSGAAALGSAILMWARKLYILALILMIVSALSAVTGLLPLVIGLLMAYLLTKHKYEFDGVE